MLLMGIVGNMTTDVKATVVPGLRCNWLNVPWYSQYEIPIPDAYRNSSCGPAAGAVIVQWWKEKGYNRFGEWAKFYVELYKRMHTNGYGYWWWPFLGTTVWWASSGWSSYASSRGYNFYTKYWVADTQEEVYWAALERIASEIDRGEPLMVHFGKINGDGGKYGYLNYHWVVICGYLISPNHGQNGLRWVSIFNPVNGTSYWIDWDIVYKAACMVSIHPR